MNLSKEEVEHVAKLARLSVTEEEVEVFRKHLSDILSYITKLNELDTADVEPTSHVLDLKNVLREDERRPSLSRDDAMSGAPAQEDGFFLVPKIIGERN